MSATALVLDTLEKTAPSVSPVIVMRPALISSLMIVLQRNLKYSVILFVDEMKMVKC